MQDPFIGNIQYFAFDYAPKGWALCNGALLPVNQNQALFALIGTYYGGDGRTNFELPDLQGRSIIGQGSATANTSAYTMGAKSGVETATVTVAAMPMHTHTAAPRIAYSNATATSPDPTGAYPAPPFEGGTMYANVPVSNNYLGTPPSSGATITVQLAGAGAPFNLLSPYIALTCCIATTGYYPSRN
jgi:microcystin-dependent protein